MLSGQYRIVGCSLLLAFLAGCGQAQIDRLPVHGAIAGAEGRAGLISFVPQDGTPAPAARTRVVEGRYSFDRSNGPLAGNYRVIIQLEPRTDTSRTVAVVKGVEVPIDRLGSLVPDYESFPGTTATVQDGPAELLRIDLMLPGTAT